MSDQISAIMDEIIDIVADKRGISGISEYEGEPRLWNREDQKKVWKAIYSGGDQTPPDWEGASVRRDISDDECDGFIAWGDDLLEICLIAQKEIAARYRDKPFALTLYDPAGDAIGGKSTIVWESLRDFLWVALVSVGSEDLWNYCVVLLEELGGE